MAIKSKKPGMIPVYQERWKEMAKDGSRLGEAATLYLEEEKTKSLTEAFKAVRDFNREFMRTYGPAAAVFKPPQKPKWMR